MKRGTQTTVEATIERLGLKDMFEKAERDGLWFWSSYQDMWFSPAELRKNMGEGRFRWGAVNWSLRPPAERLAQLEQRERQAAKEREQFQRALRGDGRR